MNLYKLLRSFVPESPLQIGTILSSANQSTRVELPGGGIVEVRGSGAVNDKVFIRNGRIEGPAPSLAQVTIDI